MIRKILLGTAIATLLLGSLAAHQKNQVTLNLEPSQANPRNSEGSFATLRSGRILFCYTQFYGGHHDNSPARIAEIHSDDQGRTWSQSRVIVDNTGYQNVMSVSLLRLASGKLAMFYLINRSGWLSELPYIKLSGDEGETWSEPKLITAAPGMFVLNNDRVIQTASGRLIVPLAFHRSRGTADERASWDSRGIVLWYLSDDEGATWREAATWWALPVNPTESGLQEPGVVQLADGSLFSWARTDQGSQYGFHSEDGGETWSAPQATELQSPNSPASIKRLPNSSALLAIYNDHSGRFPFPALRRTPLVAAVSSDNGKTWPLRKLIEDDSDGWYCYTAVHFVDDAFLLAYCAGYPGHNLDRLRIRRIALSWLQDQAP